MKNDRELEGTLCGFDDYYSKTEIKIFRYGIRRCHRIGWIKLCQIRNNTFTWRIDLYGNNIN